MITITDTNGETLSWASAGTVGFKGARKSTPFAAGAPRKTRRSRRKHGMLEIEVKVKGPGAGREQAIIQLQHAGLKITGIEDVTPLPHNGCRPPKKRRSLSTGNGLLLVSETSDPSQIKRLTARRKTDGPQRWGR